MMCATELKSRHTAGSLNHLSDWALTERLRLRLLAEREVTAEVLRLIAEVDRRKLYLGVAARSMFEYVTRDLCLSEGAAFNRIRVARAGRKFPVIFKLVAQGDHHLSGLVLLVPYLTEENHRQLLDAAKGCSKRQIEKLIAERFPRPDVPTSLRKLPNKLVAATGPTVVPEIGADKENNSPRPTTPNQPRATAETSLPSAPGHSTKHPEPLSPSRYLVKFTATQALYDKLQQAQDLMQEEIPSRDLAEVIEQAVDSLITARLKKKYAVDLKRTADSANRTAGKKPSNQQAGRKTNKRNKPSQRSRRIPAAIRREVYLRDGGQCTFVDREGRRCSARSRLQFHHRVPFGRGGQHTVENVCLCCAAHNDYFARRDYGAARIENKRAEQKQRRKRKNRTKQAKQSAQTMRAEQKTLDRKPRQGGLQRLSPGTVDIASNS